MNVLEVRDAAAKAIKHARDGKGPMILEMKTYRYRGHSMSDPAKYRSRDEVTKTRSERDPIDAVRETLLKKKCFSAHRTQISRLERRALLRYDFGAICRRDFSQQGDNERACRAAR